MAYKIFITRKIPQDGIDLLKQNGFEVEVYEEDKPIPKEILLQKVKKTDALLPLLTDPITEEVIQNAGCLKIIANYAVGFNNIDIQSATKTKIAVTNTPGVLTDATAELTWALIMAVTKRLVESDQYTRQGQFDGWGPMLFLGMELSGKTLGIVGTGRIGTAVAQRAAGFNMNIIYTGRKTNKVMEDNLNGKQVDLNELLEQSDIVSLHVPLTDETHHLINTAEFAKMKSTAYIINTSRGSVVNEKALVDALQKKQIAGAGLDVYEQEPEIEPQLFSKMNVVLLPHIGSATKEARTKMAVMAAQNIIDFFQGKRPANILNPEVL